MTTWYVAAAGSDSNPGTTPTAPFATWSKAASVYAAFDAILGNGGDVIADNPSFTEPVTLGSYGVGQSTIAGPSTGNTLTFTNMAGVIVENLTITNACTTTIGIPGQCLQVLVNDGGQHDRGITISGCTFQGGYNSIVVEVTTNYLSQIYNVSILNNTIGGSYGYGIVVECGTAGNYCLSNVNIQGNVIGGVTGRNAPFPTGFGIQITGTNNAVATNYIQGNTITGCAFNSSGSGIDGSAGIMAYFAKDVVIQNNVVGQQYATLDGKSDGIGIDIDVGNTAIEVLGNFVYNCQGAGTLMISSGSGSTHTIAGNIYVNCCNLAGATDGAALSIAGSDGVDCFGNTFLSYGPNPVVLVSSGPWVKLLNNAFVAPAGIPSIVLQSPFTGLVMDGNYHQSGDGLFLAKIGATAYTSLAAWQTATTGEAHGGAAGHAHFVQPQPVPTITASTMGAASVYAPVAGSPLLGAGANLASYGITPGPDYLGNAPTSNTIGAIYAAGAPNAYVAAVLADTPMGLWRLAEPCGASFFDSVPSFEQGAWTGASFGGAALVAIDGGTSTGFNGTSTSGAITSIPHGYALSGFTLEAWVSFASVAPAQQYLVSSFNSTIYKNDFVLLLTAGGVMTFVANDDVGHSLRGWITYPFAPNTTYHLAATWSGSTLAIYVDGAAQTVSYTSQEALSSPTISNIYLGSVSTGGDYLDGLLADVAIYPSALTAPRVAAHFAAGVGSVVPAVHTAVFSDGGLGGTFAPASVTWSSSGSPQTITYTPPKGAE